MPELIHEYSFVYRSDDGTAYVPQVWGEAREDGTWQGWIEFAPEGGAGPSLRTDRETTQHDRAAVAYWASGLEPVYFEGAFTRAV